MRIALLTDGIWPYVIGGMQKHSYYLCKYLARQGVFVDLYHTSDAKSTINLSDHFSDGELAFITDYYVPTPKSDILPGHYLRTSFRYSNALCDEFLKHQEADLIYAKGLTSWAFLKRRRNLASLPPICINVHGYEYYQRAASLKTFIEHLMLRPAFNYVNRNADYIYSYGNNISSIIKKIAPRARIIEIPAAIEKSVIAKTISKPHNPVRFVYVGRYERRKGIKEINFVIRNLSNAFNFSFEFVGPIPQKKQLQNDKVIYHGLKKNKQSVLDILKKCDILVCPSYAEGMPNVILEAMACGCAVIATDVGATSSLVGDKNGWLIPPGSQDELYRAMMEALNTSESRLSEKKEASLFMVQNNFTWEENINNVYDSFKEIISQKLH